MDKIIGVLLLISAAMTIYFSFLNDAKIFIG